MQPPSSVTPSPLPVRRLEASFLEDQRAALDLAMEASHLVWWDWDIASDRLELHQAGPCFLGEPEAEPAKTAAAWLARVHPDDQAQVKTSLRRCLDGETARWDSEYRFLRRDGRWLWVLGHGRVMERDPVGKLARRMIGTTQDIDARKRTEAELARDSELLAHIQDAVYCLDKDLNYSYWNLGAEKLYGWTEQEILGRHFTTRFPEERREQLVASCRRVLQGAVFSVELETFRRDGSRVWVDMQAYRLFDEQGRVTGLMNVARDITQRRREQAERQRIEHQLAQSQKMETLGTLAGGIAHDFNNLLAAILGYAEIAGGLLPPEHPALAKLDNVTQAGKRAAELVRRILAFSRAGEQTRVPVDLNHVVQETLGLLRASLPSTIALDPRVSGASAVVLGDATQLQQILLNCCANSAHALRHRSDGLIVLAVEPVDLEVAPPVQAGNLRAGAYVRVSVSDNGCGIAEDVLAHVFEPFFTTKPRGEGTGLGLALAHGIVTSHGGAIRVDSRLGEGTVFQIYLPALLQKNSVLQPESAAAIPAMRGAGEVIAVIDDEESIALLAQQALEHQGYRCTTFNRASDCLAQLQERPDAFDLIITDQTMPQMTGLEFIKILRAGGNPVPVLMLSGYARSVAPAQIEALESVAFLGKPFDLAVLLRETQRLLRERA
jgi:PAS domain S-box-containing protein